MVVKFLIFSLTLILAGAVHGAPLCRDLFLNIHRPMIGTTTADQVYRSVWTHIQKVENGIETPPLVLKAAGSEAPILRPFEKEGLLYQDIASWFNVLKPKGKQSSNPKEGYLPQGKEKLAARFATEKTQTTKLKKTSLTWWLTYLWLDIEVSPGKKFNSLSPELKLNYLLSLDNPFSVIPVNKAAQLFENEILNFDDVLPGPNAPPGIVVGDDLGSYEVRTGKPILDRTASAKSRKTVEEYLDGKVGHQHKIHGWPELRSDREKIQGQYIEALDATTWMLFWRQMKRDPEETESILFHPYLGIYTHSSLTKLSEAFVNGDAKGFNDKFRMVGARSFPASPDVPGQGTGHVPDWELRSGNKGPARDFIEAMVEARLASGDYTGLKDFRSYQFDPSAPIEELAGRFLPAKDIAVLKQFEQQLTEMNYSDDPRAKNHFRNKILSPLLPWENRLSLNHKLADLHKAQLEFAKELVGVAREYLADMKAEKVRGKVPVTEKIDIRSEAKESLEELVYNFADEMRLDRDFQTYLKPPQNTLPSILVPATGPLNVNEVGLGIEYSLRFDPVAKPTTKADAEAKISEFATRFAEATGSTPIASMTQGGHGHSAVVKYKTQDPEGQNWRIEWDGIQRKYRLGKIHQAWGGHVEIPTPRMTPKDMSGPISKIFSTGREFNMQPGRFAGGAHVNMDLAPLKNQMTPEQGTRAILNIIAYFESNRDVISFLWQHPMRMHAAYPVPLKPGFAHDLAQFHGDWDSLGKFLYNERYFNPYVGRKPKYSPWNMTAIMSPFIPRPYIENKLDIRNKEQQWFPNFNDVTGRIEFRLMDSPTDEYIAALQIKWFRAFMLKTLNSPTPIELNRKYSDADMQKWKENPEEWIAKVSEHLNDLGLDPKEFEPLYWDSYLQRNRVEPRVANYTEFKDFLPVSDQPQVFDKKEKPAPLPVTPVVDAPKAPTTVAKAARSAPVEAPAKTVLKAPVKAKPKSADPSELWRTGDDDSFMAFRSNAAHFWAWAKGAFDRELPRNLRIEGTIAGDAHAANFGQVLVKNKPFEVHLIDLDDSGKGPLLGDLLRLAISIKESGADIKYKEIWEAYQDGLSGGDNYTAPDFVEKKLNQTNADFLLEQQELLTEHLNDDGELTLADFDLKPMSRAPEWLKQALTDLKTKIARRNDGTEVISTGWKKHTDGGSQGMMRMWLLLKRDNQYRLVEYKQMAAPATENYTDQKSNTARVNEVRRDYWGKDDTQEYSVVSLPQADFLSRTRFEYPLNQKIKDLMAEASGKKMNQYSLYLAYRLGQIHGKQDAGKKLASLLDDESESESAQILLKKLANEYREVIEQQMR